MNDNYLQEILNLAAASSRDHPAFPGLPSPHILQAAQVQQQAHAQQQAQQLAQQQQAAQQAAQQQQQQGISIINKCYFHCDFPAN